ncbi:Disease resistance protein [Corchorus capsularis]|uniref:Disease resistance protein n=1 Tax=Corchorus capsularis TaxID=210143 RepID=A0A1R3HC52_COCAP|nr:Disease resistance protein [Corchorus capsularis]
MIKHCGGLPLAIVVLGGILATKFSLNEWKKISENVLTYLKRDKGHGIEHVLDLSYDDLPPYLKPCFLYLSHFPEDYKIEVDRLIQLWIAEGFLSIKHDEGNGLGETVEDVAECYLIELAGRYMIQVEERDVIGKIKTCRMHDVIREACLSKAKQESFLHIIDHSKSSSPLKISKVPRVAAHEYFPLKGIRNPHLRSLMLFHEFFPQDVIEGSLPQKLVDYVNKDLDEESNRVIIWAVMLAILCVVQPKIRATWTYMLNNFKLLRVLDFENDNFGGCKLPNDLGNLIHLRFLCLGNFSFFFSKLPSCLGNLRCLQTLDLRGMQSFRLINGDDFEGPIHVPNVIWKLRELRHLYLPECLKRKTRLRLDTLEKLQTLVNFNMRNCYVADLLKLTNLRDLKIVWLSSAHEAFEKHLNKNPQIITSKYLRSLSFNHIVFTKGYGKMDPTHLTQFFSNCVDIYELSISWVAMNKLPYYHHFPSDMAYVSLKETQLEEDPMPTLEKLPNLKILKFSAAAFIGNKMVCSAQGFPKLDSLSLDGLFSLEEWKMDGGAMLALRHLEISNCGLKMLPEGLKLIATLQELKITFMPNTFQAKLSKKLKPVPLFPSALHKLTKSGINSSFSMEMFDLL